MPKESLVASKSALVTQALSEHRPALSAFVRARVPQSNVEDLLQSAALKAIERADSLESPERVLPWLYRIHRNLIIDGFRASDSRRRLLDRVEQQERLAAQLDAGGNGEETCACSVHLAHTLPRNYADILSLVDLGESSIQEAATELGITANNAMVRLHRARKALKKTMMEHCGVTSFSECNNCRCVYDGCCPA